MNTRKISREHRFPGFSYGSRISSTTKEIHDKLVANKNKNAAKQTTPKSKQKILTAPVLPSGRKSPQPPFLQFTTQGEPLRIGIEKESPRIEQPGLNINRKY